LVFDVYIAVDWSAKNTPSSKKPSADALWVAVRDNVNSNQQEYYFRTREECCEFIRNHLMFCKLNDLRVLIGYDFDFGFPSGLSQAMGNVTQTPWIYHWEFLSKNISDASDNSNNRFEVAALMNDLVGNQNKNGPFWGVPRKKELEWLQPKSPSYPFKAQNGVELVKKRWCEFKESKAQPVWKLLGTASVGGQTLVGISRLYELRFDEELKDISKIWPFETGFDAGVLTDRDAKIVHVEIWPGLLTRILDKSFDVRDQAQVKATVDWFAELDSQNSLPWLMTPPDWLSEKNIKDAATEEGWVIGAGLEGQLYPSEPTKITSQGELFD